MKQPTKLILHVQDLADGLIGPFDNYQGIVDHIQTLQQFNPGSEVQAIYPSESYTLQLMLQETMTIAGAPVKRYRIMTPEEDIQGHIKAEEHFKNL